MQNFPLDSIGEFNFETQRFRADTGRANGGTIKVVTKGGTNELPRLRLRVFRDKSLNGKSDTEKLNNRREGRLPEAPVRRQPGRARSCKDKTHFFVSFERVQQDTTQVGEHRAASTRTRTASSRCPYRENMAVGKVTHQLSPNHYLSVRYGFNNNSQPYGASPLSPPENWGDQQEHVPLRQREPQLRARQRQAQRVHVPVLVLQEHDRRELEPAHGDLSRTACTWASRSTRPRRPSSTSSSSATTSPGSKGRHEFKVGASFINEPMLDITFSTGQSPHYTHLADSRTSPISSISFNGSIGGRGGERRPASRTSSTRFYLQDGWRVDGQADPRPRGPLRLRDRLRVRPGRQHHLPRAAGRGRAGLLQGARSLPLPGLRGLRQVAEGGHEQHRSPRRVHLRRQG